MSCKVLIVEANEEFREHLRQRLLLSGFSVFGVGTHREGLRVACEERVKAVLIGVTGPQRSQLSFIREVREACPEASVVIINHSGDVGVSMAGMEYGALDEISAPVDMTALGNRLQSICENRG